MLQTVIVQFIENDENDMSENTAKVIVCMLQCIEILYENITPDSPESTEVKLKSSNNSNVYII